MTETVGMTIEQKADWIADGPSPRLDRSGQRWRRLRERALTALRETVEEIEASEAEIKTPPNCEETNAGS